jgi:hypothetical protein
MNSASGRWIECLICYQLARGSSVTFPSRTLSCHWAIYGVVLERHCRIISFVHHASGWIHPKLQAGMVLHRQVHWRYVGRFCQPVCCDVARKEEVAPPARNASRVIRLSPLGTVRQRNVKHYLFDVAMEGMTRRGAIADVRHRHERRWMRLAWIYMLGVNIARHTNEPAK